jgi:hypothetical protein
VSTPLGQQPNEVCEHEAVVGRSSSSVSGVFKWFKRTKIIKITAKIIRIDVSIIINNNLIINK